MVDYVMTPETFSLYKKGDREVALFGDNHAISNGAIDAPHYAIPVTDYLRKRLIENPNLHVYGEIAEDEPGSTKIFGESTNKELNRLRALKNDRTFPYRDRIHNIDIRNNVVPLRDWKKGVGTVYKKVKKHLRQRAPELLKRGTPFRNTENQMDSFLEDTLEPLKPGEDRRKRDKLLADSEHEISTSFLNPIVDADIIDTIRMNPHKAKSMIFYVGDGHKIEAERHFLDKEWIPLHKGEASVSSLPLSVPIPGALIAGAKMDSMLLPEYMDAD